MRSLRFGPYFTIDLQFTDAIENRYFAISVKTPYYRITLIRLTSRG